MWLFIPPHELQEFCGISLCAGVAGLDVGVHIAEPRYRTVCYVERNSYSAATLVARMADQTLAPAPIWDDLKSFDGKPWRGKVHLITAGYPCQPFTYSGSRKGEHDPRHLWPEVARIVGEVRPQMCFFENVPGHLSLGLQDVARDLQEMGYGIAARVVSAAEVGGSHIRERVFILAHADNRHVRQQCRNQDGAGKVPVRDRPKISGNTDGFENGSHSLDDPLGIDDVDGMEGEKNGLFAPMPGDFAEWRRALQRGGKSSGEPMLHRLDDGMAFGLDRSAAAGNGVVSMAAARAWVYLNECLNGCSPDL